MAAAKKSVGDLSDADLKGKKVLIRCDLNVPLDGKTITDDTRIRASVPTIKYLLKKGAKVAISSHLGRPKVRDPTFSSPRVLSPLTRSVWTYERGLILRGFPSLGEPFYRTARKTSSPCLLAPIA